jgi:hypothetical protein
MPSETVRFRSTDGTRLTGRIVRTSIANPWVYFLHGNAGNLSTCQAWGEVIHRAKLNLFVIDYRGFGESEGAPSEKGVYEDADAGYAYLTNHLGAPPDRIFAYGHSLGAAIAVNLASQRQLAGLILEGALISVPALGQEMYPFLPINLIAVDRFDSLDKISRITIPKLFMHGRADHIVPIDHGRRLYAAAPAPKDFMELDAGHNDSITVDADKISAKLQAFTRMVVAW